MLFLTSLDIPDACVETGKSSTFPNCYQTSRPSVSPHLCYAVPLHRCQQAVRSKKSGASGSFCPGSLKESYCSPVPRILHRAWSSDWKLSIRVPWAERPQSLQLGSQAVGAASAGVLEWLQTAFSCFRTQDASRVPSIDPGRCCSSSPFQINKIVPSAFHPQSGFLYIFIEC